MRPAIAIFMLPPSFGAAKVRKAQGTKHYTISFPCAFHHYMQHTPMSPFWILSGPINTNDTVHGHHVFGNVCSSSDRAPGRPHTSWQDCVREDLTTLQMQQNWNKIAQGRVRWRSNVHKLLAHTWPTGWKVNSSIGQAISKQLSMRMLCSDLP